MLTQQNRKKLEEADIRIFDYEDMVILSKKPGSKGNSIPNFKGSPIVQFNEKMELQAEVFSDCPHVSVSFTDGNYVVSVWNWVPGPGPGDFELTFENEEKAMDEVWNYFFGDNVHFQQILNYHTQRKNNV